MNLRPKKIIYFWTLPTKLQITVVNSYYVLDIKILFPNNYRSYKITYIIQFVLYFVTITRMKLVRLFHAWLYVRLLLNDKTWLLSPVFYVFLNDNRSVVSIPTYSISGIKQSIINLTKIDVECWIKTMSCNFKIAHSPLYCNSSIETVPIRLIQFGCIGTISHLNA